jgi:hypothetical protein
MPPRCLFTFTRGIQIRGIQIRGIQIRGIQIRGQPIQNYKKKFGNFLKFFENFFYFFLFFFKQLFSADTKLFELIFRPWKHEKTELKSCL